VWRLTKSPISLLQKGRRMAGPACPKRFPDQAPAILPGIHLANWPVPSATAPVLPDSSHQALTPREIEVLRMLAEGLGHKTMAWLIQS
jgi:DNA-binding NarL/FixJ family response regulator